MVWGAEPNYYCRDSVICTYGADVRCVLRSGRFHIHVHIMGHADFCEPWLGRSVALRAWRTELVTWHNRDNDSDGRHSNDDGGNSERDIWMMMDPWIDGHNNALRAVHFQWDESCHHVGHINHSGSMWFSCGWSPTGLHHLQNKHWCELTMFTACIVHWWKHMHTHTLPLMH